MECVKKIPAITFDTRLLFTEEDPVKWNALMEEEERQEAIQRNAWEEIVSSERFAVLSFTQECEYPLTIILHPSTRPGVDWQVTRLDYKGVPNGHNDFFKDKPKDLYRELMGYSRSGVTVRILYKD